MPTRLELVEYARTLKGTPFHHQGRVPKVGIDCIGTIIVPMRHFGLVPADFDVKGYSRISNPYQIYGFLRDARRDGIAWIVPRKDRLPGDVALLRVREDPQHFVWITDVGILHAQFALNPSEGRVVEHRMDQKLIDSIIQVYRLRGVE